jgi:cobalt-zinc-cadmium efflux system outer membrane protein
MLANSEMELLKSERESLEAKAQLANLWGGSESDFTIDEVDFDNISKEEISEGQLIEGFLSAPDALALAALEAQAKSTYELEKANSLPDPTIGFGARDFRESNERAFVASFSMPLPVFNKNQGNIIKAQNQLTQVAYSNEAKLNALKMQALNSLRVMKLAERQISDLRDSVIPTAEKALKETRAGYDKGKFPYIEIADAQQTLFEARFNLNNALKDYHIRKAEIERFLPIETNN